MFMQFESRSDRRRITSGDIAHACQVTREHQQFFARPPVPSDELAPALMEGVASQTRVLD
jgi:hypothetical protein